MAGRQLRVVGPRMMESAPAWRMITPAWSTALPTRSNLGMLVPEMHATQGPVSIAMQTCTGFLVTGSLSTFLEASIKSRAQSQISSTGLFPCKKKELSLKMWETRIVHYHTLLAAPEVMRFSYLASTL